MKKINILLFCVFFDDPAVIIAVNIGLVEKHCPGEGTFTDKLQSCRHAAARLAAGTGKGTVSQLYVKPETDGQRMPDLSG